MTKLTDWTAKRAGGRITINGTDAKTGEPRKVVGVDTITAAKAGKSPVAVDKDGARYELT